MTTFLLIEGFDVYPDINSTSQGLQARWLSSTGYGRLGLTTGRFAGQALNIIAAGNNFPATVQYALYPALSGTTTLTIGFAFNLGYETTQYQILGLRNNGATGTLECGIAVNSSQQAFVFGPSGIGTPLATSATAISTGSWHYFELVITVGASGSFTLYQDGLSVASRTGVSTGTLSIDTLELGSPNGYFGTGTYLGYYDDVYVTSTAARLGERRVSTLYPASNGAVAWTPLTSTNYVEVSETLCDGDTSYVSTSTAGASDLYGITSLPSTPVTIDAVQVRCAVRKSDSSSHVLNTQLLSNTTTATGANFAIAGSYLYDCDIHTTDPNTGGSWTASAVNSCKIGQVLVS